MLNDEEHVAMILEARDKYGLKPGGPELAEYTPEVARLDLLIDAQRIFQAMFARANGAKAVRTPQLQPRPETAVEAIEHRTKMAKSKSIADRFMHRDG